MRSRLDDLPRELRSILVNFTVLEMRAVLAHLPQFRIRPDDAARGRKRLCEWAAEHGYLDLLKWAHEHAFPLLQLRDGKDAWRAAVHGGHVAVLQWLREIRCRWDDRMCFWAAKCGHLQVLQWARAHRCGWFELVENGTSTEAAKGGHLHVLQWLRSQGCSWSSYVTYWAARNGHLNVLEWALAKGCTQHEEAAGAAFCSTGDPYWLPRVPAGRTRWHYFDNTSGLTLDALRHVKAHRPELAAALAPLATGQLACVGDVAGLEWARENGFLARDELQKGISRGGHLAVLQWAITNHVLDHARVDCLNLAVNGHLACLQWVVANGTRLSATVRFHGVSSNHLSVAKWLHENGCALEAQTLASALDGGCWEVFEWARQKGCPVDVSVIEAAVRGGYAEVLQWAFDNAGRIKRDPTWCSYAANVQVLKVLRDRGCAWSEHTCSEYASVGDLELLQFAVHNGCPWDAQTTQMAHASDHAYVLQWAAANGCPMNEAAQKFLNKSLP